MKTLILTMLLITANINATMIPLWDEDDHFLKYRTMQIESSVFRLGELVKRARKNPENMDQITEDMDLEVYICKVNLGYDMIPEPKWEKK